jgi:hypothetical protein
LQRRLTGRNTLDTTTTSETTDGRLGDALDVVTENLSVTLGTAFAETFAAFSTYKTISDYFFKSSSTTKKTDGNCDAS